jgi:capsule polysaccharide modification protein KpsS
MTALLPIPDAPGYYTELFFAIGKRLKEKGFSIVYIATTPYYSRKSKLNLEEVGTVYNFDKFLQNLKDGKIMPSPIDAENSWGSYSTFVRQNYYYNRHKNSFENYKLLNQFVYHVLRQHPDIEFVMSELISSSFLYAIYNVFMKNKIQHYCYSESRIPGYFNVFLDDVVSDAVKNGEHKKLDLDHSSLMPDYMNNSRFGGVFDKAGTIKEFVKESVDFLFAKNYNSWETGNSKLFVLRVYAKYFRRWLLNAYLTHFFRGFAKDMPVSSTHTYILYPLHFRPEASTSVQAKYYEDDYEILKNIAFSMRPDQYLVVKEHKSNVGNNEIKFYRRIESLPNTILLDPYFPLKQNLRRFDALVCLTSTAGFEALENNIPVFLLGRVFYEQYPGCVRVQSFEQLENCIQNVKKNNAKSRPEITDLYHATNFPGTFNYMMAKCLSPANIDYLIEPILALHEAG